MESWKSSLDRYLTTEPDCGFDNWCEQVTESFTDNFFDNNEDWIMEYDGLCNKWLNKLIDKEPKQAAILIERAFKIYCV